MHLSQIAVTGFRAASSETLTCNLPGRFAVLAGANSGGKSTIVDAILLAHRDVFPFTSAPSTSTLSKSLPTRTIAVAYDLTDDVHGASPLGTRLNTLGEDPAWETELSASMGRVVPSRIGMPLGDGQLPILYLSPTRQPARDLGGRDARLIVELLRSQALRTTGSKSLADLRVHLKAMVNNLVTHPPVAETEQRVAEILKTITDGVSGRVPFLGTTFIDDEVLARVFEFFIAGIGIDRIDALRLEAEGAGYANLLQLAIVLAAIPDLTHAQPPDQTDTGDAGTGGGLGVGVDEAEPDDERSDEERTEALADAERRRQVEDDTFFPAEFHSIVLLEEPEAHLHPQLQHTLIRHLKTVTEERPEVQVIVTTHSDQVVAACDPNDLVVMTRRSDGIPVARTIKNFDLPAHRLRHARFHLDVNRSSSLFTDRVVLVEGVTDALVLRALARIWAQQDPTKVRFVDALTITTVGSRIGQWLPDLLVHPGHEIASRLAILRDTDGKPAPDWHTEVANEHIQFFSSDPTLEPSLVENNEDVTATIFSRMKLKNPPGGGEPPTSDQVRKWFRKRGRNRKADFAYHFARLTEEKPGEVVVPSHFVDLLEFVWDGFVPAGPDPTEPLAPTPDIA